jgi:hypothetical protein
MRVNGLIFDAATRFYNTNRALQSVAGSGYWFAEFQPVNFVGLSVMFRLLEFLFNLDICCHVSGAYPSYLVGFQKSFAGATMFIALKELPLLRLKFQIGAEPLQAFYIGPIHFIFLHSVDDMDVCRYHAKLGDCTIIMMFIEIDARVPCGHYSNVDFVHFIWLNINMLGFRRHALTFLPVSTHDHGRLLCLRHYRVANVGWTFVSGCVPCRDQFRETPQSHRIRSTCRGMHLSYLQTTASHPQGHGFASPVHHVLQPRTFRVDAWRNARAICLRHHLETDDSYGGSPSRLPARHHPVSVPILLQPFLPPPLLPRIAMACHRRPNIRVSCGCD